jgi:hypothetical protein
MRIPDKEKADGKARMLVGVIDLRKMPEQELIKRMREDGEIDFIYAYRAESEDEWDEDG